MSWIEDLVSRGSSQMAAEEFSVPLCLYGSKLPVSQFS